ncbi:MAG: glycine cleavage system protein H [Bacteroidales bacterium]
MITDGQRILESSGYSELVMNERQSKLDKLTSVEIITASMEEEAGSKRSLFFLIGGIILLLFVGGSYYFLTRSTVADTDSEYNDKVRFIEESKLEAPRGLYYDKTHTWAFMERDGQVKIGIDDFIQKITGPVTRVLIKNPGEVLKKGEKALTIIQKGKQMVIYSPVSGTITGINELLLIDSAAINRSPFNEGWVYEVEPENWSREIQQMNLSGWYRMWLKSELSRFKDFLAKVISLDGRNDLQPVMQDGGEVTEHVLENLDPRIWEEFQTSFLDPSK